MCSKDEATIHSKSSKAVNQRPQGVSQTRAASRPVHRKNETYWTLLDTCHPLVHAQMRSHSEEKLWIRQQMTASKVFRLLSLVKAGRDRASTASVAQVRPALLGTSDAIAFLRNVKNARSRRNSVDICRQWF